MFIGIFLHIILLYDCQHLASEIKVGLRKISCLILSAGMCQEQFGWKADDNEKKNRMSKGVGEEVVGWSAHSKVEDEEEDGGGEAGHVGGPVSLSWYR